MTSDQQLVYDLVADYLGLPLTVHDVHDELGRDLSWRHVVAILTELVEAGHLAKRTAGLPAPVYYDPRGTAVAA